MISHEYYKKLYDWINEPGCVRNIQIRLDNYNFEFKETVYIYDYMAIMGVHVVDGDKLPSTEELKDMRKQDMIKKLESM